MPEQVLYTLHTIWEWAVYQIEEILTLSKAVEDRHQVKIQHVSAKNTFEIIGIDYDTVERAREDFSEILMAKSSEAKIVLTVPPREKKPSKFDRDPLVVVDDPSNVLNCHHRGANNTPFDYWKDICKDCNVTGDLFLDSRKIRVTGGTRRDIEKAIHRLRTLEQIYLRSDFRPKRVPLVHYPNQDVHFKLYFLPLKNHGYFKMTIKSHADQNVYLLIHAILDPKTGKYKIPSSQKSDSTISISELRKKRSQYTEANTTSQLSTSSSSGPILWNTKTQDTNFQISKESKRHTDIFDEKPYKEDMDYKTKKIDLQKSPEQTHHLNLSNVTPGKMLRDYNFVRTKDALIEGMEHVRAFRGEIRFSGRLGKVLFSDVPPQVSSKLWEFYELKDIIKEKCVRSSFTEIATHEEVFYNGFTKVLDNKAYYTNQYFEIDADARNALYGEYTPVTMYINMNYVSLEKVMMKWNRVADVEWSVLDRISTRKALRHDVRPFNTFMKKVSISPSTRIITFENVPEFLEVNQVKNITVNKYHLHFPFIAEVNRVEILPLNPQKNSKKIQGKTDYGTFYYTIEIYDSNHREMLSKNQNLVTGTIASWTVCDLLGEDPTYINMVEFIKTMLLLVERCNKVAEDKLKELLDEFKKNL
nr:16040_t:CDS:10 [Entrophospora candida]